MPAGGGNTLHVQKGLCAADGRCQTLFIYLNDRFLGTDWAEPSLSILDVAPAGTGQFNVTYASYVEGDPACCPSQPPATITFRWDGTRLRPDGIAPGQCRNGC